jgi:hypothetical protein
VPREAREQEGEHQQDDADADDDYHCHEGFLLRLAFSPGRSA